MQLNKAKVPKAFEYVQNFSKSIKNIEILIFKNITNSKNVKKKYKNKYALKCWKVPQDH